MSPSPASAALPVHVVNGDSVACTLASAGLGDDLHAVLERAAALLTARGLRTLVPERLPPNDGGIAYGQAAVAAARDRAGTI